MLIVDVRIGWSDGRKRVELCSTQGKEVCWLDPPMTDYSLCHELHRLSFVRRLSCSSQSERTASVKKDFLSRITIRLLMFRFCDKYCSWKLPLYWVVLCSNIFGIRLRSHWVHAVATLSLSSAPTDEFFFPRRCRLSTWKCLCNCSMFSFFGGETQLSWVSPIDTRTMSVCRKSRLSDICTS